MSVDVSISSSELAAVIGTGKSPLILDVRTDDDFAAAGRALPISLRMHHAEFADLHRVEQFRGRQVVVYCQRGKKLSQGAVAWLRHYDVDGRYLEGGFEAWRTAGGLTMRPDAMPAPDVAGRTVWVTRERPKIDRIACPWLIRRFVDPSAVFLFVAPAEVEAVAERFAATPFDIDGVFWSHRGDRCSFDTMIEEFGLNFEPLLRLADIVRGADTARPELAPQAPGLLAASLGLSRLHQDDLEQLEAGMILYDAFYLWCRDAYSETHNWPSTSNPNKA